MSSLLPLPDVMNGQVTRLAGRSSYVESLPVAASNSGLVVGDEWTLVIDTRLTPALGRNLRHVVEAASGQRAERILVVNTHFHGDHWFGNAAFSGSLIIASEWTRRRLASQWPQQVSLFSEIRPAQADEFQVENPILPTVGIHDEVALDLGDALTRLVPVGHAHTPGDVVALTENDTVAYTGDVVFNGHWPVLWDADYRGWQGALADLFGRGFHTVVPGHGPAGGPEILLQMARCLEFLAGLATLGEHRWELEIDRSEFRDWLHRKRIGPSVASIRKQLDGVARGAATGPDRQRRGFA